VPPRSYIARHPIQREAKDWPLSIAGQAGIDMVEFGQRGYFAGIASAFREEIPDVDAYVASCRLVWSHSALNDRAIQLLPKFDAVVYVVRDPRDVAISMGSFRFTEYSRAYHVASAATSPDEWIDQNLDDLTWHWVKHVARYASVREHLGIHFVFYERLLADLRAEMRVLADLLELSLPDEQLDELVPELSFRTMQRASPQHLRHGRAALWRDSLGEAALERVDDLAGPMLELFGYPRRDEDGVPAVPALPPDELGSRLHAAYHAAKRVADERCRPAWEF
jgi:aryl sulfotransferase